MKAILCVTSVIVGIWLLLMATPAEAQSVASAQIQGVVSDPSGAAVPKAEIKVIQTNTQFEKTTSPVRTAHTCFPIFLSARTGLKSAPAASRPLCSRASNLRLVTA